MGQKQTKDDWKAWHYEIREYSNRPTQGWLRDIAALEAHIKFLREVAPRDNKATDRPCTTAMDYIQRLTERLREIQDYQKMLTA